jgi:threonine/homoserine efflux transporter RhtA
MHLKKGKPPSSPGRPNGFYRWLIHHSRQAARWLVAAVARSLPQSAASFVYLGGAILQRTSSGMMQPLTVGGKLGAMQAASLVYAFGIFIYGGLLVVARGRLDQSSLREARPNTDWRDRFFKGLLRMVEGSPPLHAFISGVIGIEEKNRWIITVIPFLAAFLGSNLAVQLYAAKLPLASGQAIVTFGPLVLAMVIAWRERKKGLPLFLPLISAAGAAMLIPWGDHIDGGAVLAALGGGACSAVTVWAGKNLAEAGIFYAGSGISMGAGLAIGSPWVYSVHWTWEIAIYGAIAGLLTVAGSVLLYLSQGPMRLEERMVGVLAANSPGQSTFIGYVVLRQTPGPISVVGILTILLASILNASLTGPKAGEDKKGKYNC